MSVGSIGNYLGMGRGHWIKTNVDFGKYKQPGVGLCHSAPMYYFAI